MHAPLLQVILHAPWLLPILLYIILLCMQFSDSTTYKFVLYNLSKVMLSVNFLKVLLYLLMRISLLMSHFSVRITAGFSLFPSCFNSAQWYIIWSIVCSPFFHEHVGPSMILYLYKYDLILQCPVSNVAKFGVILIFSFNLSAILGKCNFVTATFVVQSHSVCWFFYTAFTLFNFHCAFWDSSIGFGLLLMQIMLQIASRNVW
jgi:hypothetical protein